MPDNDDVPSGPFCYSGNRKNRCPYWRPLEIDETTKDVVRAQCRLTGQADDRPQSLLLLWDQVKCCHINEER